MNLLLVEDDTMLAEALCAGIRQHGFRVDHVGDAARAKTALVDHDFDAVLLDLGLPGSSGLSVLSFVRGRYDATPVLIITARDKVQLNAKGVVRGDIRAGKMVMSEGASFYGQCAIGPEAIKDGAPARPSPAASHSTHAGAVGPGQRPPLKAGEAVG